ncbi:MAG TPA: HD-GYP domain-containing protein [Candidatus Limnocylindria bacterium]|jgi:putative nucleotidyltransferase with HDIG domain
MRKLRWPVRSYVVAVIGAGLAALVAAAAWSPLPATIDPSVLAILFAMAAVPKVWPIHLSTKMKVTADDAATFAAALLFGPVIAMLLALVATIAPSRLPTRTPLYNRLFNSAVMVLALGSAAQVYALLARDGGVLTNPLAVTLAAGVNYVMGTALVDIVVALQLRRDPISTWWPVHRRDIAYHGALYALGALAALVAGIHPLAIALVAAPVGIILLTLRHVGRLGRQTRAAIVQLADLIDRRDKYTYGHSQRVAEYANRLARHMNLAPSQVEVVTEAARLHDLGKVATPDEVLLKASSLGPKERSVMREHAETGYRLLAALPDFWEGAALVRAHHERADGSGYPLALGGSELPLEASIISVCDAYDAMSSDRVYRHALSWTQIRAELERGRGSQWDPRAVDGLLGMLAVEREKTMKSARAARLSRWEQLV